MPIVDDDPEFNKTLKDILQARDYKVTTEIDPEKALSHHAIRNCPPMARQYMTDPE